MLEKIKRREFMETHGREPERVHLTRTDENDLCTLEASQVGDPIASILTKQGPRVAFPKLMGMTIVWDAAETRVE
jgi:hypothetical protein